MQSPQALKIQVFASSANPCKLTSTTVMVVFNRSKVTSGNINMVSIV